MLEEFGFEGEEEGDGPMTNKGFFGFDWRGEGVAGLGLGLGLGLVVGLGFVDKVVAVGDNNDVFLEKKEVIWRC